MLLAIETSCDETAVALFADPFAEPRPDDFDVPRADLISSQTKLHEPYGGVVPELAAREHLLNLPAIVDRALETAGVTLADVTAVAVTRGPGLKGCLLVGLAYAKALSYSKRIPLIPVHHIEGHMLAGELMGPGKRPEYPCLALVVSGGHTMLVLMKSFRDYQVVARTRDDAAGEAFDKSATLLKLPYPGGPSLSKLAELGDPKRFRFPIGVSSDAESFSFSGLKTAVMRTCASLGAELDDEKTRADLAASVQHAIVKALVEKSATACKQYRPKSFLLTGGVAANRSLRSQLESRMQTEGVQFCVPDFKWCTDNAAMIGILALRTIQADPGQFERWRSAPAPQTLGPNVPHVVGVLPRWPIVDGPQTAN